MSKRNRLGGCQIEGRFSKGVHSNLYKASSEELARPVMIKVLDARYPAGSRTAQRFLRGGDLARTLEHPNIVQTYASGKEGTTLYMLMAFLKGHSLDRVLEHHGTIPWATALDIARQVATAMEYAARQNIVHRSIEPSHIMLSPGGRVSMLGFGMARLMESQNMAITAEGALVGIGSYSCPEAGLGVQDIRGDLYSLGAVLYHMLSGQPPFTGRDPLEILHRHRTEKPRPLRNVLDPATPVEVDEIVSALMTKEVKDRIQTPGELIACIDAVIKPDVVGSTQMAAGNQTVIVTTRELMALRHQRSVLIADAQPYNIRMLHEVIHRLGLHTLTTRDAEAALGAADEREIHMVITDLKLPGMAGPQFLREIRKRFPEIPIIVTRGGALTQELCARGRLGNITYLERPLHPGHLRTRLQEVLS